MRRPTTAIIILVSVLLAFIRQSPLNPTAAPGASPALAAPADAGTPIPCADVAAAARGDTSARSSRMSAGALLRLKLDCGLVPAEPPEPAGDFPTHLAPPAAPASPSATLPTVGTNVRVNDPTDDDNASTHTTQSEVSLAVSGGNIVVAFNDSGDFVPSGNKAFTGYARSTNGGATFTDLEAFDTGTGNFGDPALAVDSASNAYLATLGRGVRTPPAASASTSRPTAGSVSRRRPTRAPVSSAMTRIRNGSGSTRARRARTWTRYTSAG